MLTLYYSPGACSINPHIALRESGLDYRLVRVDLRAKTYEGGGDYLEVNPKGYVPALRLDDGQVLTENVVIVQYIADLAPSARLAPPVGTMERLRLAEMLTFIATELHKGMGPFSNPKANDELKSAVRERVLQRWGYLSRAIGEQRFLFGENFTVADSYAFYVLRSWKHVLRQDPPTKELAAYYERLTDRSSVQHALEVEGLKP